MGRQFVSSWRTRCLIASASVSALWLGACSGTSTETPGGNKGDGGESIYQKIGTSPPSTLPPTFIFSDQPAPYKDAAGCKAFTSATIPAGYHPDVRACTCDNCFDLQQQCDALEGCQEIQKCGIDIGCSTANDCYLAPSKTNPLDPTGAGCVAVTDKWANSGVSSALSLQLGACSTTNKCR